MKQTIVQYGRTFIYHCQTRRVDQQNVADASGIDHENARITVSVEGYMRVSSDGANLSSGIRITPSNGKHLGKQYEQLMGDFYHPRQPFRMFFSDSESGIDNQQNFLNVIPQDATGAFSSVSNGNSMLHDVAGGPRCTEFSVLKIVSGDLAKVSATFVMNVVPCDDVSSEGAHIVLNRWSVRDSIDHDFYTTRTYNGRLKVSSPLVNPNTFRGHCIAPLAPGMKLQQMDFEVSEDGMTLAYTVTHKEAAFSAPYPATSWEVSHTESTGDAKLSYGSVQVMLRGDRNVNKKELIQIAMAVIDAKLSIDFNNIRNDNIALIDDISVTDYTNSDGPAAIMANCRVQHIREGNDADMYVSAAKLGRVLTNADLEGTAAWNYDNNLSRLPPGGDADPVNSNDIPYSYGMSGPVSLAGALSVFLQQNCSDDHSLGQGLKVSGVQWGPSPGSPAVKIRSTTEVSENLPPWYSADHAQAAYTEYRIESNWDQKNSRIQLPVAAKQAYLPSESSRSSVTIGLGLPIVKRIVRIRATRIGEAPQLQSPLDQIMQSVSGGQPRTYTLLDKIIVPTTDTAPDGKVVWIVDAEYHYAVDRPLGPGEGIPIGLDVSLSGTAKSLPASSLTQYTEASNIRSP